MGANLAERKDSSAQELNETRSSMDLCSLEKEFLSSSKFSHSMSSNDLPSIGENVLASPRLSPVAEKETRTGEGKRCAILPKAKPKLSSSTDMERPRPPLRKKEKAVPSLNKPSTPKKGFYIEAENGFQQNVDKVSSPPKQNLLRSTDTEPASQQTRRSSFCTRRHSQSSSPPSSSVQLPPVMDRARRRSSAMSICSSITGKPLVPLIEQPKSGPRSLVDQLLNQFKGMQSFSFNELRTTKVRETFTNSVISKPIIQFRKGRPINSGAVVELAKRFMGFQ